MLYLVFKMVRVETSISSLFSLSMIVEIGVWGSVLTGELGLEIGLGELGEVGGVEG